MWFDWSLYFERLIAFFPLYTSYVLSKNTSYELGFSCPSINLFIYKKKRVPLLCYLIVGMFLHDQKKHNQACMYYATSLKLRLWDWLYSTQGPLIKQAGFRSRRLKLMKKRKENWESQVLFWVWTASCELFRRGHFWRLVVLDSTLRIFCNMIGEDQCGLSNLLWKYSAENLFLFF